MCKKVAIILLASAALLLSFNNDSFAVFNPTHTPNPGDRYVTQPLAPESSSSVPFALFAHNQDTACSDYSYTSYISGHEPLKLPRVKGFLAASEPVASGACSYESKDLFDININESPPAAPMLTSLHINTIKLNPRAIRAVEKNIKVFSSDLNTWFDTWLARSGKFIRLMKNILREEGIPEELAYLPLIESGFNVRAYSRARAAGPWQFIASTARSYGLKINWWIDERRDPVKSTRAAARYLKDLHTMFDSWSLALAAYNAGEGKVRRAIKRNNSRDFWKLVRSRDLRRETKNYVPRFIAAWTIAKNPEYYGFSKVQYESDFVFDEVTLTSPMDIEVIAESAGTAVTTIKDLNPELRRWSTPANVKSYTLRIPRGTRQMFLKNIAALPEQKRFSLREYYVRQGDTVSEISQNTGVPVYEIIAFNQLNRRAFIREGQKLMLPVHSSRQRNILPGNLPIVTLTNGVKAMKYKVRWGDTISTIAAKTRLPKSSIVSMNNLDSRGFIRTGQVLYLPLTKTN